ncbi:MAG TPA: hypothetical protein VIG80_13760 [Bacillaceae bacterium]
MMQENGVQRLEDSIIRFLFEPAHASCQKKLAVFPRYWELEMAVPFGHG